MILVRCRVARPMSCRFTLSCEQEQSNLGTNSSPSAAQQVAEADVLIEELTVAGLGFEVFL